VTHQPEDKIVPVEKLVEIRQELAAKGAVVVQCHGCFDIVHPGHIRYLKFAREQGDRLIVSVSGDRVVGKGVDRPYIDERLRMENLAALEFVDYVCLDENDWAGPILEKLRPDVYVKGKEYEKSSDPRFAKEKALVEDYGGRVIFSSGEVVYSSTYIIEQFRHRFQLEEERVRFFCERRGITKRSLFDLLDSFTGLKVLVIGDPILDRYVHCDASGLAAEGPILNVTPLREEWFLGAAGLMARQCAALGSDVAFLTVLGDDATGARFHQFLGEAGVDSLAVEEEGRPVFVKTRYLVDETKVFKVNVGRYAPLPTAASRRVVEMLEARGGEYDAWLVSDFGYGFFGHELIEAVASLSRRLERPYFVDVSTAAAGNLLRFAGPRTATPTEEELRFAYADRESGLSHLAMRYYRDTGAELLVITMGKRGAVLFEPPEAGAARLASDYLPALNQQPVDTVGAGDVFTSTFALVAMAGGPTAAGVVLANAAAGLHVSRLGNEAFGIGELQEWLEQRAELPE
jgi:rfaE bifunctional protein kinase chain/domain/rfaE bifunctional protein nucleotidyltransferase chain/domain